MEEILIFLLKQSAVVVVLGLGIWDFRAKLALSEKDAKAERKAHKKELKEMNDKSMVHAKEYFVVVDKLTDALEKLKKK